jgi:hypothetical protein
MSYPEQPNFSNQPNSSDPHSSYGYPPQLNSNVEGEKHAQSSLILGIISLFAFGVVIGPLAMIQARKAEALNVSATPGKITGLIGLILGIVTILGIVALIVMSAAVGDAVLNESMGVASQMSEASDFNYEWDSEYTRGPAQFE